MRKKLVGNLLALSATLVSLYTYADEPAAPSDAAEPTPTTGDAHPNPSNTSNTTTVNETQREQEQVSEVQVHANRVSLGGGLMSVQEAPKAVSTISRSAILQAAPGANYAQMIQSIPGVLAITDDVTGLNDANYSIRGFTNDEIGVTVNGAPINDSGNYRVFPTEYGDTENMSDITVLQGYPDVNQPVAGAAGGTISWVTVDPSHTPQIDLSLSGGSHDYERGFVRFQTGDTGPVRSWVSYSHNEVDLWRGDGNANVQKIDGKSVWTIDDNNSVSASVQYNHEMKYAYFTLSKAQANTNYFQNYDTTLLTPTDTNYWRLHTNPFDSLLVSMDGEFHLGDTTRLSVIPYFQYGGGGGGGGTTFTESTSTANYGRFAYTNQDVDNNGTVSNGKALVYELSRSYTWRPGAIAKVIQQLGHDDSLEFGFWIDQPRQEQSEPFTPTVAGAPVDIWQKTDANQIRYSPNGSPQYLFNEYTETSLRRAFLENTWTPTNQWTLTTGVAYTWEMRKGYDFEFAGATAGPSNMQQFGGYSRNTYQKATPTAGIKYQLNDQNQFYAGYGRTFRAPINGAVLQNATVLDYYEANPGAIAGHITPAQLAAVANNKPEIADTLDVGWRYYTDSLSTSIDAYASNLKNKQVSGFDNATSGTVYLAVPELHQRGVNAEASYKIYEPLTLYGSYAYTKSTFAADLDSIGDGYFPVRGKSFLDTPKNTGYVSLKYDHGPLWASVDAQYRSSFWGDWMNTERAGGFTTMDFSTGWRFDDFASWLTKPQIKFNVFNLTDKHALTYDSTTTLLATKGPKDPRSGAALFAGGAFYNLLEPRTFMITIKASLF